MKPSRLRKSVCVAAFACVVLVGKVRSAVAEARVPVIDISPWLDVTIFPATNATTPSSTGPDLTVEQRDIVDQIRRACREVGFFQITGGLPNKVKDDQYMIDRTWKASRDFFDLSLDEKLQHQSTDNTKYPYGYERSETLVRGKQLDGEESIGENTVAAADLKETFALGPPTDNGSGMPPRQWINSPNVPPGFRPSLEVYYQRMEELALVLLQIFAIALDEPPDFFQDKMDRHMSALRLVHYYPLEDDASTTTTRLVRAGAHTDYGALTILAARDEGLEVLLRDSTDPAKKNWYPVPVIPESFVVNLGDLMQRWTNHEWVSTMHRVVMPSTKARERRYSMAYFVNINGDTPIEPLRCCRGDSETTKTTSGGRRVITAGEHLMAKHLASMGITMDGDETEAEHNTGEL